MVFSMNQLSVILPSAAIMIAFIVGGARFLIKKYVEKTVDASFERRLEALRSDLRVKEGQISALQTSALNNRAGRDALIEKRKIEAIEGLWKATVQLRSFRMAAITYNILKMDMLNEKRNLNEQVRKFIENLGGVGDDKLKSLVDVGGDDHRLFVPVDAWASFAALRSILTYVIARLLAVKHGVSQSEKLVDGDNLLSVIRAAMPGYGKFLDEFGIGGIGNLVEPLEDILFAQLQRGLRGEEADSQAVERAANVLRLANEVQTEMKKAMAEKLPELRGV